MRCAVRHIFNHSLEADRERFVWMLLVMAEEPFLSRKLSSDQFSNESNDCRLACPKLFFFCCCNISFKERKRHKPANVFRKNHQLVITFISGLTDVLQRFNTGMGWSPI